jgi:hypothetical protein
MQSKMGMESRCCKAIGQSGRNAGARQHFFAPSRD